jgi:hypothetical protein
VLGQHPEFLAIVARSRAELAAGRKLSLQEMKRAVLLKRRAKTRTKRAGRARRG